METKGAEAVPEEPGIKIAGAKVKKLRVLPDDRGHLMEMLRSDDDVFEKFGQAYLTTAFPGVVKAWHFHKVQVDHWVVVKGQAKVVLYDDRPDSATKGALQEFYMGERNQILLKIPAGVYHGFKNVGTEEVFVINFPTEVYDYENPDEFRRPAHGELPYDWSTQDR